MSQTSPPIKPRSKFDTGLGTRKGVVGEHYVNEALARGSSEFAFPMQELVTEWCWGNIWNCPSLDRKQRSLLSASPLVQLYDYNHSDNDHVAFWLNKNRPWHADCAQKLARGRCTHKRSYKQWLDRDRNQGIYSTIRSILWSTRWP